MSAASKARNTPLKDFRLDSMLDFPVADGYQIWQGTLTVLNASGKLIPGEQATGLVSAGIALQSVDNTDDGKSCNVFCGIGQFTNGDSIAQSDVGATAYVKDDQTVVKSSASASAAGKIVAVDSNGVWVNVGLL